MVRRPLEASVCSAACTASRMSFTPESTAESAMNSASTACAIRRASVVLPEPGGPHRIIECSLPDSKAMRSGLPGPSRWFWPTTSVRDRGRSRSASGAAGAFCPAKKSFPKHVRPSGRAEAEGARVDLRVAHHVGKAQHRGLAEIVHQLHRLDAAGRHAEADTLEAGLLFARLRFQPFEAVLLAHFLQLERFLDVGGAGEQRRRGGAQHARNAPHGDLVQVGIVDPHTLAVADDDLLRLDIGPAEAARAQEREAALRVLHQLAGAVIDLLLEIAARRLR